MENAGIILATLVAYKLLLIGVGWWASRRTHTDEDFFLGGRGLGPLVAAVSYSASASSAWTLLGLSGAAFVMGVSAIWLALGAIAGMLIAWWVVSPRLFHLSHRHRLMTLTELLALGTEGRWRTAITVSAALIVLAGFSFYVAAQFQGAGNTFQTVFGLSMTHSIVLGGLIIMVYTFLGGFWAVSITDTIQGLLMAFAALLLPITGIVAAGGIDGLAERLEITSRPEQLSLTGRHAGLAAVGFVVGLLGIVFGTFGQPHLLVRFMALRDEASLRQARMFSVIWYVIVFGGMFVVGLVGRALLTGIDNPETVFFDLTDHLFPTVIAAVLVAAVLSAIMSTADSQLLVGASAVAHDLGLNRRWPERRLLISRAAIALLVVIAIIVSLTLPASIFDRALLAWTALGAAFGPLVFFRVLGIGVTARGALAAILTGFGLAVLFHFNPGQIAEAMLPDFMPANLMERVGSFVAGIGVLLVSRTGRADA